MQEKRLAIAGGLLILASVGGLLLALGRLTLGGEQPPAIAPPVVDSAVAIPATMAARDGEESESRNAMRCEVPLAGALRVRAVDATTRSGLSKATLRLGSRKRLVDAGSLATIAHASADGEMEVSGQQLEVLEAATQFGVACVGYATAWIDWAQVGASRDLEVALDPGSSVRVRVVDDVDSLPVSGALVALGTSSPVDPALLWAPSRDTIDHLTRLVPGSKNGFTAFSATDADGLAAFHCLPPGEYSICSFKAGMWQRESIDLANSTNASLVRIVKSRDSISVESVMSRLFLAVAAPGPAVDVVAAHGRANGLSWSALSFSSAIDRMVRERFPDACWHRYGLRTSTEEPNATVTAFVEGSGWITQAVDVMPFDTAKPTSLVTRTQAISSASGRITIEAVSRDGLAVAVESCVLEALDSNCSQRVLVGKETRMPPGKYKLVLPGAPWLREELAKEIVEIRAGELVEHHLVVSTGIIRIHMRLETFDGDHFPSVSVAVFTVATQERLLRFTSSKREIDFMLPRDERSNGFRIVAGAPGLAGSLEVSPVNLAARDPIQVIVKLEPK